MKFKGRLSHFRYKPIVLSSLFYYHNAPYSKNVNTIKVLIAILKVKSYINVHAKKKSNTKLYFIIVKKNKNILYLLKHSIHTTKCLCTEKKKKIFNM